MRFPSAFRFALGAALAASSLAACSSDGGSEAQDNEQRETPLEAFGRVCQPTDEPMPADGPEPGGYTLRFERYTKGAEPQRLERRIVRPFGERTIEGGTRSLGFLNDSRESERRVIAVRPGPNDPRPRLYPPDASFTKSRRCKIAGGVCQLFEEGDHKYCIDNRGIVRLSADADLADIATDVTYDETSPEPAAYTQQLAAGFTDVDLGSIRPIAPDSSPPGATDYFLAAPPAGFTHIGRYAVVPLSNEILARDSYAITAGIVDVYVRGIDTLVVDRGGRLDTGELTDADLGAVSAESPVSVDGLGDGQIATAGHGPFGYREVRVLPKKGRYVVVTGTLPADELIGIARSLRATPGTELRYLDQP